MKSILLQLTGELIAALHAARGDEALGPYVELLLRRSAAVRSAAKQRGIEFPARPKRGGSRVKSEAPKS